MTTDKPATGRMATPPDRDDEGLSSHARDDDVGVAKVVSGSVMPLATPRMEIQQLAMLLKAKETELRTLQKTHDEYIKSSCEYEKELEAEIERVEKKSHSLEQLMSGVEAAKAQLQATLTRTQQELSASTKREEASAAQAQELKWKVQRLEQTNDELETANRVAQASIDELQHQVEKLTEENVFLLQEKEDAAAVQAASDEDETKDEEPKTDSQRALGVMGSEPANRKVLEKRRSARFPEVVESCLHMTCTSEHCRRASHIHQLQNQHRAGTEKALAKGEKTKRSFFERLRLRFMRG